MKKLNKILSLAMALMMVLALCACGSTAATTTTADSADGTATEEAAAPANALEKIKAEGVLYVATSPDFAPMEFVDASKSGQDQYVGFDISLAKYLAEYMGVELVIEPLSFDACQTAVYTGSVPMSISGFSWTEERAENYELSDEYIAGENETEQVILINAADADKYTTAEDFAGLDVGAQIASLQMNLLTEQIPDANPITIGDINTGILELKSGNIVGLAVAKGNGESIMASNPDLVICDWQFDVSNESENNVIMITKGETELLDLVNEALAQAKENGLYGPWYEEAKALALSDSATEVTMDDSAAA